MRNLNITISTQIDTKQVYTKFLIDRVRTNSGMKRLTYRILLRKEPEGGYTVIVPSLPGCVTYGETINEAIKAAKEAVELYLESLKKHGEEIPTEEETLEYTLTVEAHV
jgi:predicted RNase H-like HicB family nuclease